MRSLTMVDDSVNLVASHVSGNILDGRGKINMLMQHVDERHGLACGSFSAALGINFLSTFRGFIAAR